MALMMHKTWSIPLLAGITSIALAQQQLTMQETGTGSIRDLPPKT